MSQPNDKLTDDERAELEELRAERAARQRAAANRSDRDRLEAEQAARDAEIRRRNREMMEPDEDDLTMSNAQKMIFFGILVLAVAALLAMVFGPTG